MTSLHAVLHRYHVTNATAELAQANDESCTVGRNISNFITNIQREKKERESERSKSVAIFFIMPRILSRNISIKRSSSTQSLWANRNLRSSCTTCSSSSHASTNDLHVFANTSDTTSNKTNIIIVNNDDNDSHTNGTRTHSLHPNNHSPTSINGEWYNSNKLASSSSSLPDEWGQFVDVHDPTNQEEDYYLYYYNSNSKQKRNFSPDERKASECNCNNNYNCDSNNCTNSVIHQKGRFKFSSNRGLVVKEAARHKNVMNQHH